MNNIAIVAISGTTREFDKKYHYSIPDGLSGKVVPGIRVIVPFGGGNSLKEGYVFALTDTSDFSNLKDIKKIVDDTPVLSGKMIRLAEWMRDRYVCTYSDAIKCMLPAGIGVKSFRVVHLLAGKDDLNKDRQNKDRQKLIELLKENDLQLDYEELKRLSGIKSFSTHIRSLENSGTISISEEFTSAVKEKYVRVAYLAMPAEEVQFDMESNRIKRIQHIRVLEMLMENEYISVVDLARFAGIYGSVLDTLRKQGYIGYKELEVMRDPVKHKIFERTAPFKPTAQQASALQTITGKLEEGKFAEILVHGVTGSGKTEVYLQLIQKAIENGRQAIVLVPEISLTPQMVERFKGRFGDQVAVLHSRLSLGEKYDQWRLIKDGRIKVAVGARSAVFAPFEHLDVIIIDEEHETSYKSETTPKYRASEIAVKRCLDNEALVIYGSATP
ncbi:MAG: DEAD/DEAH box helicase, partial [Ruminiclostridium sp.]|nr:DEAD/DEAH box helicase [Ruminiclostridium sp.]